MLSMLLSPMEKSGKEKVLEDIEKEETSAKEEAWDSLKEELEAAFEAKDKSAFASAVTSVLRAYMSDGEDGEEKK